MLLLAYLEHVKLKRNAQKIFRKEKKVKLIPIYIQQLQEVKINIF